MNFIPSQQIKMLLVLLVSTAGMLLIGFLDYATGYELSFFIFYIFPIAITAWYAGRWPGILISGMCLIIWYLADRASGHTYSQHWIIYWNAMVRFCFFMTCTYLISALKTRFDFEKDWARIDALTGAMNGRGFRDRLEQMFPFMARTKSPFAMAFIDLDNFKKVNDTKGHAAGDAILQRSVKTIKDNLRETDFIGRLGGDEFAIFLPATNIDGAEHVLKNLREKLLIQVDQEEWEIGFSIGAVTFDPIALALPPYQDIIHQADELMYKIKHSGKNNLLIAPFQTRES